MLGLHTVESVLDRLGKPEPATVESLERAALSWIRPVARDAAA